MSFKSFRAFRAVASCSFILALCAPALLADPLPVELTGGPPNHIQVNTNGSHAFPLSNGGGGFAGQVWERQAKGSGIRYDTTLWCIDSQLYFSNGNNGLANITRLSSLPTVEARYGTIDDAGGNDGDPSWTNGFGGVLDTAPARFHMAAWLVQQYSPFPNGPADTSVNRAIQRSIWAIINNDTPDADTAGWSEINGAPDDMTQEAYWVNLAKANYASVNSNGWAVVSWLVNDVGGFVGDKRQTFLVQVVTPEPGFYAVLGIGLILLLVVRRRRQNALGELAS